MHRVLRDVTSAVWLCLVAAFVVALLVALGQMVWLIVRSAAVTVANWPAANRYWRRTRTGPHAWRRWLP